MKKTNLWSTIKDELIYWLLILILLIFFIYLTTINASKDILFVTGILNVLILETWFVKTFFLYSGRKISQYSEVIQRISFKDRLFDYFILPAIFLSTFIFYLYFNKDLTMSYWMTFLAMVILLILFVNVKSSMRKIYKLDMLTKGIFNLVCIFTFYLSINVFLRFDIAISIKLLIVGVLAFLMFASELQLHDRMSLFSILVSMLSAIFVTLTTAIFISQSIFVATAIGTVAFYMIISLWNVRFSGKYKFPDYLPPLIYGVIALILIFNL